MKDVLKEAMEFESSPEVGSKCQCRQHLRPVGVTGGLQVFFLTARRFDPGVREDLCYVSVGNTLVINLLTAQLYNLQVV
jgi:hypothetical protein